MRSIFGDQDVKPAKKDIVNALGPTFQLWQELVDLTRELFPQTIEEWKFSGEKYGWSFRLCDKKRVLLYLLPRDKFFKVAFVFGQKATDAILKSTISKNIREEIKGARVYAEGRGIRIDVRDNSHLEDIKQLIAIKIQN